jgi:hypothetical protein
VPLRVLSLIGALSCARSSKRDSNLEQIPLALKVPSVIDKGPKGKVPIARTNIIKLDLNSSSDKIYI